MCVWRCESKLGNTGVLGVCMCVFVRCPGCGVYVCVSLVIWAWCVCMCKFGGQDVVCVFV